MSEMQRLNPDQPSIVDDTADDQKSSDDTLAKKIQEAEALKADGTKASQAENYQISIELLIKAKSIFMEINLK